MCDYCRFGLPVISDDRTFQNPAKVRMDALILRGLHPACSAFPIQVFNYPLLTKRAFGDVSSSSFIGHVFNH
jgi:hypothetical protein